MTKRSIAGDLSFLALALAAAATPTWTGWVIVAVAGIATVGLGHGAFDLELKRHSTSRFAANYLAASLAMLVLWHVCAPVALLVFLASSAWHFGQADLEHLGSRCSNGVGYLSRGLILVALPLLVHPAAVRPVTDALGVSLLEPSSLTTALAVLCVLQHLVWLGLRLDKKRARRELLTLAGPLIMLTMLPPLLGFALVFSLGHSVTHMRSMKVLRLSTRAHWRAVGLWAASLFWGAGVLVAIGLVGSTAEVWAGVFTVLSALALPHVVIVDRWHRRAQPMPTALATPGPRP